MSKRIETKVSVTAQKTCLIRAISYYEQDKHYQSNDFIAPKIISSWINWSAKYNLSRTLLKKHFFKRLGMYEYLIARTKFIDDIFDNLPANIEQVLIFGAGFDSRAIRFSSKLQNAQVFELDAPVTQQAKIRKLRERNVELPANLKFIAIDFTKEALQQKLAIAGFQKKRPCLFLLEGLTYYLNEDAIDSTFKLISDYAGKESLIVFDYASAAALRKGNTYEDPRMKKFYQSLVKAGEKPGFAVQEDIQDFLTKYDFALITEFDSAKLAEEFFNQQELGPIVKTLRIVKAVKR